MGTNWNNDLYSNMQRQTERKRQQEQERKRQEEERRRREEEARRREEQRRKEEEARRRQEEERKRQEEARRAEEQRKREQQAQKFAQGSQEPQTYAQAVYGNKWREPMPKKDVANPASVLGDFMTKMRQRAQEGAAQKAGGMQKLQDTRQPAPQWKQRNDGLVQDVPPAQPTTITAALDGRSRPESARAAYKDIGGERRATAAKEGAPSEPMVRITAPRQGRSVNASRRRSGNGNSLLPKAPQAEAKPYTRTLMDRVLAHKVNPSAERREGPLGGKGDTGDAFLTELNRDSWEQEYRDGRKKEFENALGDYADKLLAGKVKPSEGLGKGGERSDGDLADPFLQGLFGEKELKDDFMRQQTEKLKPLLEARIAELRGQVDSTGSVGEDSDKDAANSMNMVYTMGKDDPKVARDGMIAGTMKIDPQAVGNIMQPASATVTPARSMPKSAPQPDQTGGSNLDLGMGPITQEKADEVRAAQGQENGSQWTTQPPAAPQFIHGEDDVKEMQQALGIAETGQWDEATEKAYRTHMDNLTGMLYQDQPQIAGLPFDKDGLEANGCATTATNNVLQLMGRGVPYEQIYAWHRENGDSNFPGTIPWRTEQYIKDMVPDVNIRSAASLFGMVVPMEDKETLLRAQAQQVISEDGYGILCFTYSNPDGSIGAHYVAVESNPDHTIGVYDYDPNTGTAGVVKYKSVHEYLQQEYNNGVLISAWGLSPK